MLANLISITQIQNVLKKISGMPETDLTTQVSRQAEISPEFGAYNAEKGIEAAVEQALNDVYQKVSPAVVQIETDQDSLGTGFIITEDGLIATNYHVVSGAGRTTVMLSNQKVLQATLIGVNTASDVALLRVSSPTPLKTVPLGNSDLVEVGDFAVAIGNPFGFTQTFTFGIVSSNKQYINTNDGQPRIQTDVAINPGNSGGPLLNIKGEVIGINQMIASKSGGSEGIGFAIPVNLFREVAEDLLHPSLSPEPVENC